MGVNISIQEGGSAIQLTVDKLKTDLVSGGTCKWLPENAVQLTTKNISKNGNYSAANDGYYGYSSVLVSGIGSVTGINPNDGNEHYIHADSETNMLVDNTIPSSIAVTTPPNITQYSDGDTIDYTGLVITAYKRDGQVWTDEAHPNGVIPIRELVFPVTTAEYDPDVSPYGEATYEGNTINYRCGGGIDEYEAENGFKYNTAINTQGEIFIVKNKFGFPVAYFTDLDASLFGTQWVYYHNSLYERRDCNIDASESGTSQTSGGITYHFAGIEGNNRSFVFTPGFIPKCEYNDSEIANILFGGIRNLKQSVPIYWTRQGGDILEAKMQIEVTPVST